MVRTAKNAIIDQKASILISLNATAHWKRNAILFIIFDLEIAFLFPWAVAFKDISMLAFWSMMVFLAVLTIGFAYEWKKGALEWE